MKAALYFRVEDLQGTVEGAQVQVFIDRPLIAHFQH